MNRYIVIIIIAFSMCIGTVSADTIHVPANYSCIQDAIDCAEQGDIIFVGEGLYHEHITIDKSITLLGDNAVIDGNGTGDVVAVKADDVTICGFAVRNGITGIHVSSSNSTIENNLINDNRFGIIVRNADDNIILDNMILGNGYRGISVQNAENNVIIENTITRNHGNGIQLQHSMDNVIKDNTLSYNEHSGIFLRNSDGNVITDNSASRNRYSIYLIHSNDNVIKADVIDEVSSAHSNDNLIDAKSVVSKGIHMISSVDNVTDQEIRAGGGGNGTLYVPTQYPTIQAAIDNATHGDTIYVYNGTYLENIVVNKRVTLQGENRNNTTIDGNGRDVVDIQSPYVNISEFTLTNGSCGITMTNRRNCNITDCDIHSNTNGIYFFMPSRDNIINNCTLYSNTNGLYFLQSCRNNTISNCSIYSNTNHGIFLWRSCIGNTISNCTIDSNTNHGIFMFMSCGNNEITDCIVHSNNKSGIMLQKSCNGNTITNCNTSSNLQNGIVLFQVCNNNSITSCNVTSNKDNGVLVFKACDNNTILNCTASSSSNGVFLSHASCNNMIANCNAINNSNDGISMFMTSKNNTIANCNADSNKHGIHLDRSCEGNRITNCTAIANMFYGIALFRFSANSTITNCNSSSNKHGIYLDSSCGGSRITNCAAIANTIYGIALFHSSANSTIINSTINDSGSYDFKLQYASPCAAINTTFNTVDVSFASPLSVKNYLDVFVNDSAGPVSGADVNVTDEGNTIYTSSGYGGTDPQTDVNGLCSGIMVTDRVYYSSVATENTTAVSVKYGGWEEKDRDVNMSRSHTEVFTKP